MVFKFRNSAPSMQSGPHVSGRRAALLAALWLVLAPVSGGAQAQHAAHALEPAVGQSLGQAVAQTGLSVGAVVLGILNYTSWPGESRSLTLCMTSAAPDADAVLAHLEQNRTNRPWRTLSIAADAALPAACDAVYFDAWQAQAQRQALRGLAGKPVLSMGWGREFCSDGGLFCLENSSAGLRFEANLDAVSRSGLRINPLVLRLARPRPAPST